MWSTFPKHPGGSPGGVDTAARGLRNRPNTFRRGLQGSGASGGTMAIGHGGQDQGGACFPSSSIQPTDGWPDMSSAPAPFFGPMRSSGQGQQLVLRSATGRRHRASTPPTLANLRDAGLGDAAAQGAQRALARAGTGEHALLRSSAAPVADALAPLEAIEGATPERRVHRFGNVAELGAKRARLSLLDDRREPAGEHEASALALLGRHEPAGVRQPPALTLVARSEVDDRTAYEAEGSSPRRGPVAAMKAMFARPSAQEQPYEPVRGHRQSAYAPVAGLSRPSFEPEVPPASQQEKIPEQVSEYPPVAPAPQPSRPRGFDLPAAAAQEPLMQEKPPDPVGVKTPRSFAPVAGLLKSAYELTTPPIQSTFAPGHFAVPSSSTGMGAQASSEGLRFAPSSSLHAAATGVDAHASRRATEGAFHPRVDASRASTGTLTMGGARHSGLSTETLAWGDPSSATGLPHPALQARARGAGSQRGAPSIDPVSPGYSSGCRYATAMASSQLPAEQEHAARLRPSLGARLSRYPEVSARERSPYPTGADSSYFKTYQYASAPLASSAPGPSPGGQGYKFAVLHDHDLRPAACLAEHDLRPAGCLAEQARDRSPSGSRSRLDRRSPSRSQSRYDDASHGDQLHGFTEASWQPPVDILPEPPVVQEDPVFTPAEPEPVSDPSPVRLAPEPDPPVYAKVNFPEPPHPLATAKAGRLRSLFLLILVALFIAVGAFLLLAPHQDGARADNIGVFNELLQRAGPASTPFPMGPGGRLPETLMATWAWNLPHASYAEFQMRLMNVPISGALLGDPGDVDDEAPLPLDGDTAASDYRSVFYHASVPLTSLLPNVDTPDSVAELANSLPEGTLASLDVSAMEETECPRPLEPEWPHEGDGGNSGITDGAGAGSADGGLVAKTCHRRKSLLTHTFEPLRWLPVDTAAEEPGLATGFLKQLAQVSWELVMIAWNAILLLVPEALWADAVSSWDWFRGEARTQLAGIPLATSILQQLGAAWEGSGDGEGGDVRHERHVVVRLCYVVSNYESVPWNGARTLDCEYGHRSPVYIPLSATGKLADDTVEISLRGDFDPYVLASGVTRGCSNCRGSPFGTGGSKGSEFHACGDMPSSGSLSSLIAWDHCFGYPARREQTLALIFMGLGLATFHLAVRSDFAAWTSAGVLAAAAVVGLGVPGVFERATKSWPPELVHLTRIVLLGCGVAAISVIVIHRRMRRVQGRWRED